MSVFSIQINFSKCEIPSLFLKDISEIIAETFKQSVDIVCGGIVENTHIMWRGSMEPAIFLVIQSVCDVNQELNKKCSSAISHHIEHMTSISMDRIVVSFTGKVVSDFAVNGYTLHKYI